MHPPSRHWGQRTTERRAAPPVQHRGASRWAAAGGIATPVNEQETEATNSRAQGREEVRSERGPRGGADGEQVRLPDRGEHDHTVVKQAHRTVQQTRATDDGGGGGQAPQRQGASSPGRTGQVAAQVTVTGGRWDKR